MGVNGRFVVVFVVELKRSEGSKNLKIVEIVEIAFLHPQQHTQEIVVGNFHPNDTKI